MSKLNEQALPLDEAEGRAAVKQPKQKKKKKKKKSGAFGRFIRRTLLLIFTIVFIAAGGLILVLNTIFNGPSEAARAMLTLRLSESPVTMRIPGLFLDEEQADQIRNNPGDAPEEEFSDAGQVIISKDGALTNSDQWKDCPDGIRIEAYKGETYNACIMIIRDPDLVYMATCAGSSDVSIRAAIEAEDALAAISAGVFPQDAAANPETDPIAPAFLIANGEILSHTGADAVPPEGFAGFTFDNTLVVSPSMTPEQAGELNIRDGFSAGPALIVNGEVNREVYSTGTGYSCRTAIGQRADGSVIFLYIDGCQVSSLGGTYRDMIDLLIHYGAVNACSLDSRHASMIYPDTQANDGEPVEYVIAGTDTLQPSVPGQMPWFWMVRPQVKEG